MDTGQITDVLRDGILVCLKLGGPMLILSMVVGILVAIFQAVTQIHEQTLSFIFKLLVIVLILVVGGGWMMTVLKEYTLMIFDMMLR